MNTDAFDPQKFLQDLKHEDAEHFKARVLKRLESVLIAAKANPERLSEIHILLPDESI